MSYTSRPRTTSESLTIDDDSNKVHHSDLVVDEIRENPAGRDEHHLEEE